MVTVNLAIDDGRRSGGTTASNTIPNDVLGKKGPGRNEEEALTSVWGRGRSLLKGSGDRRAGDIDLIGRKKSHERVLTNFRVSSEGCCIIDITLQVLSTNPSFISTKCFPVYTLMSYRSCSFNKTVTSSRKSCLIKDAPFHVCETSPLQAGAPGSGEGRISTACGGTQLRPDLLMIVNCTYTLFRMAKINRHLRDTNQSLLS
jgi:hypothetical protein